VSKAGGRLRRSGAAAAVAARLVVAGSYGGVNLPAVCCCLPLAQEVFTLIQPDDVRFVKAHQPRNLARLILNVRSRRLRRMSVQWSP
jgi:hypothetical protein